LIRRANIWECGGKALRHAAFDRAGRARFRLDIIFRPPTSAPPTTPCRMVDSSCGCRKACHWTRQRNRYVPLCSELPSQSSSHCGGWSRGDGRFREERADVCSLCPPSDCPIRDRCPQVLQSGDQQTVSAPFPEPEPMVVGSLARMMGHELGHSLTLPHPTKSTGPKGRLMGGGRQGYLLTPEEMTHVRELARKQVLLMEQSSALLYIQADHGGDTLGAARVQFRQ
jgi:hypothetical protein